MRKNKQEVTKIAPFTFAEIAENLPNVPCPLNQNSVNTEINKLANNRAHKRYKTRVSVCDFPMAWLQIAIEPFALFHHSVCDY